MSLRASPLLRWLTVSGADAVGRIVLQVGGTVLFARLLLPENFGLAAVTAVYVGLLSMAVSALFEEALVQRLHVRKPHFRAALAAVLALAALLYSMILLAYLSVPSGWARLETMLSLSRVYGLILFADAALSIHLALARRQRRFAHIALGNLLGLALGTACGLILAWRGGGAASLLAVQLVARFANLLYVSCSSPVRILPRFERAPLRQLIGFGGLHVLGRATDALGEAALQTLVTRLFGLEGNGYLNMAMRIVEPIRGMTGSIGHNIAMSYFTPLQRQPQRLAEAVTRTASTTSLFLQPVFFGVAAAASAILAVIAGPEWLVSAPVASLLAIGAALSSATGFLHSGLSASGRAWVGFACSVVEALGTVALALLFAPLGLIAVGLARVVMGAVDAAAALAASRRAYGLHGRRFVHAASVPMLCAVAMAISVWLGARIATGLHPALVLGSQVLGGIAIYGGLVLTARRREFDAVLDTLRSRRRTPAD